MKAIVLCESPLQIKNCISYLKENKMINNSFFLIRLNNNERNNHVSKEIIKKEEGIEKVIFYKAQSKISLLTLKIMMIFFSITRNYILIGDYRSKWMFGRLIPLLFKYKNLVFVDDGLATINYKKKLECINHKNITLYTSFNLFSNCIRVIKQPPLQAPLIKNQDNENAIFIGSPLIEKNVISKNNYMNILSSIIKDNKNMKIIYCKHRAEIILTNEEIKNIGFDSIYVPSIDIETSLETKKLNVNLALGLYSTALYSISKSYKNITAISYHPGNVFFNEKYLSSINNVYKHFYLHSEIKIKGFLI